MERKHIKLAVLAVALVALVIGLSVGLTSKKNENQGVNSSLASGMDWDAACADIAGMGNMGGKSGKGEMSMGKSGKGEMSMGKSGKSRRVLVVPGTEDYHTKLEASRDAFGQLRKLADKSGKGSKSVRCGGSGKSGKGSRPCTRRPTTAPTPPVTGGAAVAPQCMIQDQCMTTSSLGSKAAKADMSMGKSGKSGDMSMGKSGKSGDMSMGKSGKSGDMSMGKSGKGETSTGTKSAKADGGDDVQNSPIACMNPNGKAAKADMSMGKSGKSGDMSMGKSGKSGDMSMGKSGKGETSTATKSAKATDEAMGLLDNCVADMPTICGAGPPAPPGKSGKGEMSMGKSGKVGKGEMSMGKSGKASPPAPALPPAGLPPTPPLGGMSPAPTSGGSETVAAEATTAPTTAPRPTPPAEPFVRD